MSTLFIGMPTAKGTRNANYTYESGGLQMTKLRFVFSFAA